MPTPKNLFPQARGVQPTPNGRPVNPQQHRPGVAQPKVAQPKVAQPKVAAVSPHMSKQPVAPPVYRPQPVPKAVQSKAANAAPTRNHAGVPLASRPQTAPAVLQPKAGASNSSVVQLKCKKCQYTKGHSDECPNNPNNKVATTPTPRAFTGNLGVSHPQHGTNTLPTKKLGSKDARRRRRLAATVSNSITGGS
ncbi:MAG: hypothetical protein QOG00_293 [Pyrinomonadaceae bacterium]|jgi:hypothetical protein|nr:hypothetical protein [Pyrinomonadaceae bacterium]